MCPHQKGTQHFFFHLQFKPKELLSKYDEEIEGEKRKNFQLGSGGAYDDSEDRQMERITQQLRAQAVSISTVCGLYNVRSD